MSVSSARSGADARRPRRIVALILGLTTAVSLAACSSSKPSTSSSSTGAGALAGPVQYAANSPCPATTSTTTVTLPEIASSAALAWLYIDIDQGIFAKCGLKVNSAVQSPQVQVSSYLGGSTSLRITGGGMPTSLAAVKRPFGIYGVSSTLPIFYVMSNPSITSPSDLKGKTIAVLSATDSTYKTALIYLKQVGISPSDVHFSYVSTNPNIQAALSSGSAQAAVLGAPYAQLAMAHGSKVLYDFTKSNVKIPSQPIIADPAWVSGHTDVALNIMRAIVAGMWIAESQPAIAQAALVKHLSIDTSTSDGKITEAASTYLAATIYDPVQTVLQPSAATVDLFKTQASAAVQTSLNGVDMASFIQPGLGQTLLAQGIVAQLQKLYGTPNAKSTLSPTGN